jgi:hypothetical protein
MRSQDYLKQAANALRQAALARKQEMNDLRHQLDMQDQETKRRLNELKLQEAERLARAAETDSDAETANRTREARQMRDEESRINDQFNYTKRNIDQQLSNMQNSIDAWNRQAQNFDNQSQV